MKIHAICELLYYLAPEGRMHVAAEIALDVVIMKVDVSKIHNIYCQTIV
jgi:hypothetical protein